MGQTFSKPHTSTPLSQCFGDRITEEDNNDADVLSTVRFDETGNYLATGDRGGRVVVFQRSDSGRERYSRKRRHSSVAAGELERGLGGGEGVREISGVRGTSSAEYSFFAEFQSHTPEFDCLKSAEIEERINKVSPKRSAPSLPLALSHSLSPFFPRLDCVVQAANRVPAHADYQ